jgi:hypothetical protein
MLRGEKGWGLRDVGLPLERTQVEGGFASLR